VTSSFSGAIENIMLKMNPLHVLLLLLVFLSPPLAGAPLQDEAAPEESSPEATEAPEYHELVATFQALFVKATLEKDEQTQVDLVRRNRDLAVPLLHQCLNNYLMVCRDQKRKFSRDENPDLDMAMTLMEIYVRLYGKPVLENAVRKAAEWNLDQIGYKDYAEGLRINAEVYFQKEHPSKSLEKFLACERVYRHIGDSFGLMMTYLGLSAVESDLGRNESALFYLQKAIDLTNELDYVGIKATCLSNMGALLHSFNKNREALHYMDQSVAIHRRLGDRGMAAKVDSARTVILHDLGRTTEAMAKLRELLPFFDRTGDTVSACAAKRNLALYIMDEGGSLAESLAFCRKALEISRDIHRPGDEAQCLTLLGTLSRQMGLLDESMGHDERAFEIYKGLDDVEGQGTALAGMTATLREKGWLEEGRKKAEEALDLLGKERGNLHCRLGLRKDMAVFAGAAGKRDEARRWLEECVKIAEEADSAPITSQAYCSLSALLLDENRFDEALAQALKAVELVKVPGLNKSLAAANNAVGAVYTKLNRAEKASTYFRRSLDLLQGCIDSPLYHETCNRLAGSLCSEGRNEEAVEIYRSYLEAAKKKSSMPAQAKVLNSLGQIFLRQRMYDDSYRCFDSARRFFLSIGSRPNVMVASLMMAQILIIQEKYDKAESILDQEECRFDKFSTEMKALALGLRGLIHFHREETREALRNFLESLDIQKEMVRHTRSLSEFSRGAYTESWTWIYLYAIKCCESLYEATSDPSFLKQAFWVEECVKARIFLDSIARTGLDLKPVVSSKLRIRYEEIHSRLTSIQDRIDKELSGTGEDRDKRIKALKSEFNVTIDTLEDVLKEMRNEHPAYAYLRYPDPLAIEGFQELLGPDDVYISIILTERDGAVITVTRDACRVRSLDDARSVIEAAGLLKGRFREPKKGDRSYLSLARDLYLSLFLPFEDLLKDKKRLIISTDGVLNSLPLETLLYDDVPEEGSGAGPGLPYLLRKYSITYVPSASSYQYLRLQNMRKKLYPGPADRKELCAFGGLTPSDDDPDGMQGGTKEDIASLDATRGIHEALPFSKVEVEGIATYFDEERCQLFIGDSANESAVKQSVIQNCRFIHFSTHALANEEIPLSSSIILNSSEGEDGYWRVFEIYGTRIKAELVVLSACSTNIGKTLGGEGVFGLVRAFLYAGADSVVATNWEVRDYFTFLLMDRLYKYMIEDGKPCSEALRLAKLDAIAGKLVLPTSVREEMERSVKRRSPGSGDLPYSHPYYWAPFILFGLPD